MNHKIVMSLLLPTMLFAETPQITVDADKIIAPVNRLAFGDNMEAADLRGITFGKALSQYSLAPIQYAEGWWDPSNRQPMPQPAKLAQKLNFGAMRYPGGCFVHNYDWRKAVGPVETRGDWQFGIDEYMALCRQMGWEPVITLTDYALDKAELPQHLADFVEYLNAPATPQYPWAMKRAQWGNPKPYNVKYFELGNETYHGNHAWQPGRIYSPREYVDYAVSSARAMRAIDPKIRLGIVMVPGNGMDFNCEWNREVIAGAGPVADFLVLHCYGPGIGNMNAGPALRAVLTYPDQLAGRLRDYRTLTQKLIGRDLPLAITEFNVGSTANQPFQHRFSYLAGLMDAQLFLLWQNPDNRVLLANYWHSLNGYWGAFHSDRKTGEIIRRHATLPFLEALGAFCGKEIVQTAIADNPRVGANASPGVLRAAGTQNVPPELIRSNTPVQWTPANLQSPALTAVQTGNNGLDITVNHPEKEFFGEFLKVARPDEIPETDDFAIRVRYQARFIAAPEMKFPVNAFIRFGLADQRGWSATYSATACGGLTAGDDWRDFSHEFTAIPNCPGLSMLLRVENDVRKIAGKIEIRNLSVDIFTAPTVAGYPALYSFASVSGDGKKLYCIIINRDPQNACSPSLVLNAFPARNVNGKLLYQKDVDSLAYFEPEELQVSNGNDNRYQFTVKPHAMALLEFTQP